MSSSSPNPNQVADPLRWRALFVVLMASFMILLDISIVNVAIPTIQRNIGATYTEVEFVLVGYQMAYALTLITGGRLGDIFGRKRLFMIGVAGFSLASAACGLSQSGGELVGARVIQGFFAAFMYPQVLSVIQVSFPPRERAAAFGLFGGVIGVATISGPLVGGALIKLNIFDAWRPIFLVNVPIGIGALIAATFFLHESKAPKAQKLDIPGTALAVIALFLLIYPIVEGRDAGWAPWTFISMIASVPVFVIFGFYTRWRARTKGSPLVEPALFKSRAFVVGICISAAFFAGIPAFFLTFSLWLQIGHPTGIVNGYGFDAFAAGLTSMPFAIFSAAASGISVRLAPRIGKKIIQIGCVLLFVGLLVTYIVVNSNGGFGFHGYDLIAPLAVAGLGLGCVAAPLINFVLAGIHHGNAGSASGVLTTMQQVGGALGVAVVGVIFFGTLSSSAATVSAQHTAAFQSSLVAAGIPSGAPVTAASTGITECFNATAAQKDESATPPICTTARARERQALAQLSPSQRAKVSSVIAQETASRLADDFSDAFKNAILVDLAIFALVFVLAFFLPSPDNVMKRSAPPSE